MRCTPAALEGHVALDVWQVRQLRQVDAQLTQLLVGEHVRGAALQAAPHLEGPKHLRLWHIDHL
jgi:hypothetical protein